MDGRFFYKESDVTKHPKSETWPINRRYLRTYNTVNRFGTSIILTIDILTICIQSLTTDFLTLR